MSCVTEVQRGIYPDVDVNRPVSALALMTSLGCNLKCDYCLINKAVQYNPQYAAQMHKNTIQALKNGSFRKNVINTLTLMGETPNTIQHIELWGQEQILTLDYFIDDLPGWLEDFPNWTGFFFSTNGQTGADKIVRLIQALENSGRGMHFSLQWSYDGSYSSQNIRHDSDIKVIKTLTEVLEKLNDIQLTNLTVEMYFHGVVSFHLINELNGDINKIAEYWNDAKQQAKEIGKICHNQNVQFPPVFSIAEEVPYACSTEEGLNYFDFLMKSAAVDGSLQGMNYLANQWSTIINLMFEDEKKNLTLDELTSWLNEILVREDDDFEAVTAKLSNGSYCGNGVTEFKILYDGTLVNCQNSIFDTLPENIDPEKTISNETRRHWAKKGLFLNPATASPEEIEKYKYIWKTGKSQTFWHTWNTTFSLLYYLSRAKQVLPTYGQDLKKMINHAYLINYINQCHFNNATMTGSLWTKDTGIIRRYANGFANYVEEDENCVRKNSNQVLRGDNLHAKRI